MLLVKLKRNIKYIDFLKLLKHIFVKISCINYYFHIFKIQEIKN